MIEEIYFDTFLYVSNKKYQLIVFDKNKLKNLYNDELRLNNEFN